ncbi:MAG: TlyA family RNA methyltransferase [Traorella sp.]
MRLDVYLSEYGFVKSRTYAQEAIKEGRVLVNQKIITKPAYEVNDEHVEIISKDIEFVSRGGFKLYEALKDFRFSLENLVVADIGASTGGFSDVALRAHARHVYAIDVGSLQLDETLRKNPLITSMENTNALNLKKEDFDKKINAVVMDVSFVSIKSLIPHLLQIFEDADFIVLIKPQFEAGKKYLGKNGIVKDKSIHKKVLEDIYYFLITNDCTVIDMTQSKTKGKDGNQEYFVHFKKSSEPSKMNIEKIRKLIK